jgi:hypothetical protein
MSLSTSPNAILLPLPNRVQLTWIYGVLYTCTLYADHFLSHSLLIAIGGTHVPSFRMGGSSSQTVGQTPNFMQPLYTKKESFQCISTVFQNKTPYFNVIWGLHMPFLNSFFFVRVLRPLY